jgi:hypothetical protein
MARRARQLPPGGRLPTVSRRLCTHVTAIQSGCRVSVHPMPPRVMAPASRSFTRRFISVWLGLLLLTSPAMGGCGSSPSGGEPSTDGVNNQDITAFPIFATRSEPPPVAVREQLLPALSLKWDQGQLLPGLSAKYWLVPGSGRICLLTNIDGPVATACAHRSFARHHGVMVVTVRPHSLGALGHRRLIVGVAPNGFGQAVIQDSSKEQVIRVGRAGVFRLYDNNPNPPVAIRYSVH